MICYYCNSLKVLHVTEQMGFFHYLKKKMAFFRIFLLFGLENRFGKKKRSRRSPSNFTHEKNELNKRTKRTY